MMNVVRRLVIWATPICAFCGWAFTGVVAPYKDVKLAAAFLLLVAGGGFGVLYLARQAAETNQPASRHERFYYACYFMSGLVFVALIVARLIGVY